MNSNRLTALMNKLTDHTVFADLLKPIERALDAIRQGPAHGRVLSMRDFIAVGVLRHLKDIRTLRERIQTLSRLDPSEPTGAPLARSTWYDALSDKSCRTALRVLVPKLANEAHSVLPDRLANLPGLDQRPVRAIDGTYQKEVRIIAVGRRRKAEPITQKVTPC